MPVLGPRRAEAEDLRDGRGVVAEFARARDQADGADHGGRGRRPGARPRRRIAARGCRNRPAAGARTPHRRGRDRPARCRRPPWRRSADRRLRLVAAMDAHRERREVELAPVRPDPPHEARSAPRTGRPRDWRNRNRWCVDGLARCRRCSCRPGRPSARSSVVRDLLEPRRPDQLPADARAAVDARDRRALGRGESVDVFRRGPSTMLGSVAADERVVDRRAGRSAEHAADAPPTARRRAADAEPTVEGRWPWPRADLSENETRRARREGSDRRRPSGRRDTPEKRKRTRGEMSPPPGRNATSATGRRHGRGSSCRARSRSRSAWPAGCSRQRKSSTSPASNARLGSSTRCRRAAATSVSRARPPPSPGV